MALFLTRMAREKKSNEELGYVIPVKRRMAPGRYAFGWAKTLEPDSRGQIKVRTRNLRTTSWQKESTIHEPKGFDGPAPVLSGEVR